MITLTRRYRFFASHRLHAGALSDADNWRTYGRCNNPWGHGHEYVLEVAVAGEVDPRTGRVVDIGRLDGIVHDAVLADFDHRNLNEEVPDLQGRVPTTEVVAEVVLARLAHAWPTEKTPRLEGVRIYETRNNVFEA